MPLLSGWRDGRRKEMDKATKEVVKNIHNAIILKKLLASDIAKIKAHVKNIGMKFSSARDNLIKYEQETVCFKDEVYERGLDFFNKEEGNE
jgi:hypothetical protein